MDDLPSPIIVRLFIKCKPLLSASWAVHKVRHARGGGVREGVTVCDWGRGNGQKPPWTKPSRQKIP